MNAGEIERGDVVRRTDQDWGSGVVLSVHVDEARVSWRDVVAWVPLANLEPELWTGEEVEGINRRAREQAEALAPLIDAPETPTPKDVPR